MRILYLTLRLPWPLEGSGAAQRTELLGRALRGYGELDTLLLPRHGEHEHLERRCSAWPHGPISVIEVPRRRFAGWPRHLCRAPVAPVRQLARTVAEVRGRYSAYPDAVEWLKQHMSLRGYDVIVSRYLRPAMVTSCIGRTDVPVLVDVDDVDWRLPASELGACPWYDWKRRLQAYLAYTQLRPMCRQALSRCDHVWVTNEDDLTAVGTSHASILRNIPFVAAGSEPIEARPESPLSREILFVGSLGYEPNAEGLDRFLERVWPHVRSAESQATVRIVGAGAPPDAAARWSKIPGVEVAGPVADLRSAYVRCAFSICPVYYGGGTKIKVLESLAHGRVCVVSAHAFEGHRSVLRHGESIWYGSSDHEFAVGCIRLLRDCNLRSAMAERGEAVVRREFSYERFEDEVHSTLDGVLAFRSQRQAAGRLTDEPAGSAPLSHQNAAGPFVSERGEGETVKHE